MKGKKWIVVGIAAAVLLAALAIALVLLRKGGAQEGQQGLRYYDQSAELVFSEPNGLYYLNSTGFLRFYDYSAGEDVVVCNKPNCKHETWNSKTPEEQRCNAYLDWSGFSRLGFVQNGKLYLLAGDNETGKLRVIRSDPDRSNQTVIAELETTDASSFAVNDNTLYLANSSYLLGKDEQGMPTYDGEIYTWLYAVDLDSGRVSELTERQMGYSAELRMLGAQGDTLYLAYSCFDEKYEGGDFEAAGHRTRLYSYDTVSGEYSELPIQTDAALSYDRIVSGKVISYTGQGECAITATDLKTGETEPVATAQDKPLYLDGKLVYHTQEGYFSYDAAKGKAEAIDPGVVSDTFLSLDAGPYFYGSRRNDEGNPPDVVLVLKEDFYSGKQDYIVLDFYGQ